MSEFLDTLKQRWVEAHQRYKEAQEALAAATARHTTAVAENNSWQKAYEMEKLREEQAAAAALAANLSLPLLLDQTPPQSEGIAESAPKEPATSGTTDVKTELNKTEMIRELLREHPGMTPSNLWDAAKSQITSRPYVYSILKRLKDRDEVAVRRGKYYLRTPSRPEEVKPQLTVQ